MSQVSGSRRGDYHQAIERLFNEGTVSGLSEAQLLERFAARNDEAAFEALVERHGPMVLGVCRRFLRDPNDVDDAFQAVFLVLVRRAGDIRRKELLGNWLYGVACRVAVRARSLAARRPATITEADGDQIAGAAQNRTRAEAGFTRKSSGSPAAIVSRSSPATSRAARTRKPRPCSAARWARSKAGSPAPATCSASGWNVAAWRSRPSPWRRSSPRPTSAPRSRFRWLMRPSAPASPWRRPAPR